MSPEETAEIALLYQLAHSKAQHGGAIDACVVLGALMTLSEDRERLYAGIEQAAATLVKWAVAGGHTPSAIIAGQLRDLIGAPSLATEPPLAKFRFDVTDDTQWPTRLIVPDAVLSKIIARHHKTNPHAGIADHLESGLVHLIEPARLLNPGRENDGQIVGFTTCLGLLDNDTFAQALGPLDWQDWIVSPEAFLHVTCPKCIEHGLAKAFGHDDR